MILIVTPKDVNYSTFHILQYLNDSGVRFEVITIENTFLNDDFYLFLSNERKMFSEYIETLIKETTVVWFLGWIDGNSFKSEIVDSLNLTKNNASIFKNCLLEEYTKISSFLFRQLRSAKWIPGKKMNISKLDQLVSATNNDMLVPETIVCTSKHQLNNFSNRESGIITKPMHHVYMIHENEETYFNRTRLLDFNTIPDKFAPTLFQKKITKSFEVRALYLDGQIFASSIHTKSSTEVIDYRNYDEHVMRLESYNVSEELAVKIDNLMNDLGLICGSLDFIVSKTGDLIFLEVNPHGQLGLVSNAYPEGFIYSKFSKILTSHEKIK